jgi:hypothetical protein
VPGTAISGRYARVPRVAYDASAASHSRRSRSGGLPAGARQRALHEVPLEREEHRQRDDQRDEQEGRDHVDRRPELAQLTKIHTVIGCTFCRISATIRSFHVPRNWKIPSDAIAGRPSGRISFRKIRSGSAVDPRLEDVFGSPTKVARLEDRERQARRGVEQDDPEHRVEEAGVVQLEHRDQRHLQRHGEAVLPMNSQSRPGSRATQARSPRVHRSRRRGRVADRDVRRRLQRDQGVVWEHRVVVRPFCHARLREDLPPAQTRSWTAADH